MIPKNADIFQNLTPYEEEFIRPDEYPWQALVRFFSFMDDCKKDPSKWPAHFPELDSEKMEGAHGTIATFGRVHVRNAEDLKSDENTEIFGPSIFGKDVKVRKGTVITGPCWIGDGVMVGVGCRIKHSILLPGAKIVYGTRITHSIIGRGALVGSGVNLEASPFETESVRYEETDTKMVELGVFVGDRARISAGVTCGAGVILAPDERIKSGVVLPEASTPKNRRRS
ncbi:MAG: hypothetical protein WC787_02315 [Patescibacteria group bacterium]|jgi:NDP-sugar pyrophosphorylase family protein